MKHEIEANGGAYNDFTGWTNTFSFTHIGKAHRIPALDWLFKLVSARPRPTATDRDRAGVPCGRLGLWSGRVFRGQRGPR